jgi:nitric oxide reductase subunit C
MRRLALAGLGMMLLAGCAALPPPATATPAAVVPDETLAELQADVAALPAGDAAVGRALFSADGCVACHSLLADERIVGPSLAGVATRAPGRKPGYSAQVYLYESITHPNAYVVAGFAAGVMPQDFKTRLVSQDFADIIAFLMTEH